MAPIVLWCLVGTLLAAEPKPLWLVVGRKGLVEPIEALAQQRRADGFETVVSTEGIDRALAAAARRPDFLLLVGDDEPGKQSEPWYLPAKRMKLYRWRAVQAEEFASDAAWGDLDGDLVPEVAVGRIPARTADEVRRVVQKTLAFERHEPTAADLQVVVWGGSPEYGAAINAVASQALLVMLRANAAEWMSPWVISANPAHALCGWPPDQPASFTRQLRQGGVCAVLMGHASADAFFSMSHQGQPILYTAAQAAPELVGGPATPPMVFFSCDSGRFVGAKPCMAEAMLLLAGSPVATIAATTESHPLMNYYSGLGFLRGLHGPQARLGTIWRDAQRRAMVARSVLVEPVLRDVEGKLEAEINIAKLHRDQVLMYALLGDPAVRLRIPKALRATMRRVNGAWQWSADRPAPDSRLDVAFRPAESPPVAPAEDLSEEDRARAAFAAANAAMGFAAMEPPPEGAPWEGTLDRPGWLRLVATGPAGMHVAVLKAE